MSDPIPITPIPPIPTPTNITVNWDVLKEKLKDYIGEHPKQFQQVLFYVRSLAYVFITFLFENLSLSLSLTHKCTNGYILSINTHTYTHIKCSFSLSLSQNVTQIIWIHIYVLISINTHTHTHTNTYTNRFHTYMYSYQSTLTHTHTKRYMHSHTHSRSHQTFISIRTYINQHSCISFTHSRHTNQR